MMNERQVFDEFQKLRDCFGTCCEAADRLQSPNPEDNMYIKMAIVGFFYHDKTENWSQEHYRIVREYLNECEELNDPERIRRFNMLALGALLGLYSSGKIDDRVYRLGYILLPGFVLAKGNMMDK
jgi:hypothetical protein